MDRPLELTIRWRSGRVTTATRFASFWMDQFGVRHFTCDDNGFWDDQLDHYDAESPLSFDESPRDADE